MNKHKALIVIDMQNDYYPGGSMELEGIDESHNNVISLINFARENDMSIYFIRHIASPDAPFFKEGSEGAKLYAKLPIAPQDNIITKHYPNSFRNTPLHNNLLESNIKELIICGAMTHMCIDTTVRAAYDLGYDIVLAANACATRSLSFEGITLSAKEVHYSFLAAIDGTFASVLATKDIVEEKVS